MAEATGGAPLRLVHSSDWRLERPLHGIAHIPEHLRKLMREAPFQAATRVVETALAENADALLLAGEILDVDLAGPRAVVFLLDQFKRLEARGIPVYWAGGVTDRPDRWPPSTPLPENVTVFPIGRVEHHELTRDGQVIARVQGVSCGEGQPVDASGFHADAHGRYTIGVACGTSDSAGKEGDRVDYMALGGRVKRATVDVDPGMAHYCGTPQGRSPVETGPAGCTVVQVDHEGKTKTRFVACDAVRWASETLEFTDGATRDDLRSRLHERMEKLRAKARDVDQLVAWRLVGAGPLLVDLRPGALCDELLTDLQKHDGRQQPACWSYRLRCDQRYEPPAEWLDQETILGDLLRQIAVYRRNDAFHLELTEMLPSPLPEPELAAAAKITSPEDKQRLYDAVEKLGVALMAEGK
ncbi:MAG: hypothetical protein AAF790_06375 [Planctomycetota bacterium]